MKKAVILLLYKVFSYLYRKNVQPNNNIMKTITTLILCCMAISATAQPLPYQPPGLSAKEHAKNLCIRLTLEEKAKLMLDKRHPPRTMPSLPCSMFNVNCSIPTVGITDIHGGNT